MTPKELFALAEGLQAAAHQAAEAAKMACAAAGHPGPRDCLYEVGGGGPVVEVCGTCGYAIPERSQ